MLMIRHQQQHPNAPPVFKCAIFFSGGVLADPVALVEKGEIRWLSGERDGVKIEVPTAHVWGANDVLYPDFGRF